MYFVDACRIQPDEYSKYEHAGTPLTLPSEFTGPDLRSAPIYYGACPQTAAKGKRGKGTYFAEALVDCLDSLARKGPERNSSLKIAQDYWHVGVLELVASLKGRVTAIARHDKEQQDVVLGGMMQPAVFCATQSPPDVTVVVDVDPDAAAQVAFAELWNHNRSTRIKDRAPCWARPLRIERVPPGLYLLEVSAAAPYKPQSIIAVSAEPPQWMEPIKLE
jgi:hypothetical protein